MSERWEESVGAAVERAMEMVEALPVDPRREILLAPLRAAADRLARSPDAAALAELLRSAMQPAVVQVADGLCPAEIAGAVGQAYNQALAGKTGPAEDGASVPPGAPVMAATRGAPGVRAIARAPFAPRVRDDADAAEEGAAEDVDEGDAPEDDGVGDVAALVDGEASNDWRVTEGIADAPPPVRVDDPPPPITAAELYAGVAGDALDRIAEQGRSRTLDPLSSRAHAEGEILKLLDAFAATGGECVAWGVAWWSRALASRSPWVSWAGALALATIAGEDALAAVRVGLEALPAVAGDHAELVSEALSLATRPDRGPFGSRLCAAGHPVARATGVDLLGRERKLSADDLRRHLLDANAAVMAAALRGVARLRADEAAPLFPLLGRLTHFPDAGVAWSATRALLRFGRLDPYAEVRDGGRLVSILGGRALEVLVIAGGPGDRPAFERIVRRTAVTAASLDAIARFGDPGALTFLLHQLGDDDLADDAARALETLFGARVPPRERKSVAAWRSAVAALRPDRAVRYRRGEPWRPSVVAAECGSGDLSRRAVDPRLDELAVRAHVDTPVDLSLWSSESDPALAAACAAASGADAAWLRSSWA